MWKHTLVISTALLMTLGVLARAASLSNRFSLPSDTVNSNVARTVPAVTARPLVPAYFSVSQNYPNPFNAVTTIEYSLPQQSGVFITIYNLIGDCVAVLKNDIEDAGYHRVTWEGTSEGGSTVASGIYIYRLVADDYYALRKMIVLK